MKLDVVERTGAVEILMHGKLDFEHVDQFEKTFTDAGLGTVETVIGMDLSNIEYIDSSGLGGMIKALNNAKSKGKSLYLYSASPNIQSVFTMARLDKFFSFISPSEFKSRFPTMDESDMMKGIDSL